MIHVRRSEILVCIATFTTGMLATEPLADPSKPGGGSGERVVRMGQAKPKENTTGEVHHASP